MSFEVTVTPTVYNVEVEVNPSVQPFDVQVITQQDLADLVDEAKQYAEDAEDSADSASASASSASASASASASSANSASASASSASVSASTATTQAGIATTQAGIATTQAGIATTKAQEASQSANDALASEQASAQSASDALQSEQNALASEQASALSEANALASEQSASASASTATAQAGIATTQAGIATAAAASIVPVTIGTPANGLSIDSNQVLSIGLASGSTNGALSSTDWTTFNAKQPAIGYTPENVANKAINLTSPDDTKYPTTLAVSTALAGKQNALTNPITGTGVNGQVAFWSGTGTQTGSNNLFWDNVNGRLGIGTNVPAYQLNLTGSLKLQSNNFITTGFNNARTAFVSTDTSSNGIFLDLVSQDTTSGLRDMGFAILAKGSQTNISTNSEILEFRYIASSRQFSLNSIALGTGTVLPIVFYTGTNTNQLRLFTNGNVGINTTTDAGFRLDVNGTARVQGALTTNLTAGSVPFIGTSGLLTQNNSNLFWDNTNGRLGIGSTTPQTDVEIRKARAIIRISDSIDTSEINQVGSSLEFWSNDASVASGPSGQRVRATIATKYLSATGSINSLSFYVNDGTNGAPVERWAIDHQGYLYSASANERLGIAITSPTNTLDVNGTTRIRTINNATGDFLTTNADGVIQKRTSLQSITDMSSTISGWNAGVRQRLEHTNAGVLEWVNV